MTMSSPIHLKQTDRFVAERPVAITLIRETKAATAAGGTVTVGTAPLPPQTFRLVPIGRVGALNSRTTPDGRVVIPTHNLVGTPPKDIEERDQFTLATVTYEVVYVSRLPEWRVTAELIEHRG